MSKILPVIFENAHYLVVNKPPGIHCQYSKQSLADRVQNEVIPLLIDDYPTLKPVHRIDTNVTGGLLIAKNKIDARLFSKHLRVGGSSGHKFKRRVSIDFCFSLDLIVTNLGTVYCYNSSYSQV